MRLIYIYFASSILGACNLESNYNTQLPNTICELTKVIHESYPFYIDTLTQTCGMYNELMITYFSEKPLRNTLAKILDQKFDCGVIKFRVFENRDSFRSNKFLYTTYLSIEYLSSDAKKLDFIEEPTNYLTDLDRL